EILDAIDAVAARAADGDLSARITDTQRHGRHAATAQALNRLLDRTDAFIREAGASLTYAAEDKYFRPFLLRGMPGDFRRGAEVINRARDSMRGKAENAARLEREVAAQRAALEAEA